MGWLDIPKWQNMSKEELVEELKREYGDDPLFERLTFIYVNNCYELAGSVYQDKPNDCFRMLWSHKWGLSDKSKFGF